MSKKGSNSKDVAESALTRRRRWVPLHGMVGRPKAKQVAATGKSRSGRPDLQWLIIGGGVHGTYLSGFLTRLVGVPHEALRVLDPHARPLQRWRENARNVGMEYLRSAAVHHLDLASLSLKRFAERGHCRSCEPGRPYLIPPYGRPLLSLFNEHSDSVIATYRLDRLRLQGRATSLRPYGTGYAVDYETSSGIDTVTSENVLLAIGMDDATCWPEWATALKRAGVRAHHILDPGFERPLLDEWRRAVVYGGGLSGAQTASALASRFPGSVTLVSGHDMQVHLFDSEPSWQGGNFMAAFASVPEPDERRKIILRERHRGSLTPEAEDELVRLQRREWLQASTVEPETLSATASGDGSFRLTSTDRAFEGDLLILATGYDTRRPGGRWLDAAVEEMALPVAACGYPIVTPGLEWRRGLYVSGPLAELELGPVSRNISGAHRCAARLEYYRFDALGKAG